MECNPVLDMRVSQAELRAMFERNKQLAQRNPVFQIDHIEIKPLPDSGLSVPRNKYGNVKVEYEGVKFDSKHELKCWKNLKLREKAGELEHLDRQVVFPLVVNGRKIGRFTADFTWCEAGGYQVVADAKSPATRKETAYRLRKKLFEALFAPLVIREL